MPPVALLVAGGTGGHLFPALALRDALVRRGWSVHVATDPRVGELIAGVPTGETHRVPSATLSFGSPVTVARSAATLANGFAKSRRLLKRVRPDIVVGFGGYPTVPPLLAARLAKIPTIVHEQNAVVGRANRLIIRFGAFLATGFEHPKGSGRALRMEHVGNPIRKAILAAMRPYHPSGPGEPFRLLVFGGSQGARVFSGLIPGALTMLPDEERRRVSLVQQARPEDVEAARAAYRAMAIAAEVEPFFTGMGERLADAHLVLCRAGASTVAELSALGRPAILVPYPHALDHDQAENARSLAAAGGGWLMQEAELTAATLAARLAELMSDPRQLQDAAEAAKSLGGGDAAERLADLVERTARR